MGNGCDGGCLAGDDPGDEGIPDANRAIEDCRGLPFTEGDPERISEIGTGVIDRGWRDEPSPLSRDCAIIQTPPCLTFSFRFPLQLSGYARDRDTNL